MKHAVPCEPCYAQEGVTITYTGAEAPPPLPIEHTYKHTHTYMYTLACMHVCMCKQRTHLCTFTCTHTSAHLASKAVDHDDGGPVHSTLPAGLIDEDGSEVLGDQVGANVVGLHHLPSLLQAAIQLIHTYK